MKLLDLLYIYDATIDFAEDRDDASLTIAHTGNLVDLVNKLTGLVSEGTFGFGVFQCNDLLATYEIELDLTWATGEVFVDDPDKIVRASDEEAYRGSVSERALALLNSAHDGVNISSPYFIPGDGVDMNAACTLKYGSPAYSFVGDPHQAHSWMCRR